MGNHFESISRYEEVQERIDKELSDVNDFISGIQRIEHFNDIDAEWEFSHELIKNIEATDNKVLTVEKNIQKNIGERLQRAEDENVQLKVKLIRLTLLGRSHSIVCRSAYFAAVRYFVMENKREKTSMTG